jgi:hypothetical protein
MSKHLMKRVNDSRRIGRKALLTIGLVSAGLFFGAQSATAEEANAHAEYMKMKVGFFVHYVWGGAYTVTVNRDGSKPLGLDDLANRFDAEGLAQDLSSMGVEYVLFTAWHASMNLLYPSAVMDRWIPGHSAKRDVIRDLIKACHARNIRVLLYTHPRDGHDLSPEDQTKTGWAGSGTPNPDWAKFDKQKWNDFINEVYGELVERYGSDLIGLYLDEGSGAADSDRVIDYARLRKTITGKHPHLMLMQNDYGNLYTLDIGNKEIYYGKEFATPESDTWPSMRLPISIVMGSIFWAGHAAGSSVVAQPSPKVGFNARVPYTAEGMFRYNVLQAASNWDGGGVLWAAGPYPGGGWEDGVLKRMQAVGRLLEPVAKSVKQTYPSTSYVTRPGAKISELTWGVATKSTDDTVEYLHVLKPPAKGVALALPVPADGKCFSKAWLLASGHAVTLQQDAAGVRVTLGADDKWVPTDAVIALAVAEGSPLINVAQWKSLRASSYQDTAHHPRNAVDGEEATVWMPQTPEKDLNPWLQVDMGRPCKLVRIELSGTLVKDMRVEIAQTDDFKSSAVIATRTATDGLDVPRAQSTWRIELENRPATHFVRVSQAGQGQKLTISELKVFGRY